MSLNLARAIGRTERSDDLHISRILILLKEMSGKSNKPVEGITKLAKLDFLLRYPNCLERALKDSGKDTTKANIQSYERSTVETKMIRFRYGPWDKRYRRWIGIMVAKGLVVSYVKGKTVHIALTELGRDIATSLGEFDEFIDLKVRSQLINSAVGNYGATKLMKFIYQVFPELENMKWGDDITL